MLPQVTFLFVGGNIGQYCSDKPENSMKLASVGSVGSVGSIGGDNF